MNNKDDFSSIVPESNIGFAVYEDAVEYLGIASVQMPGINYLTATVSGAGLAGNIEVVLKGMIDALTVTINFTSVTGAATRLMAPEEHTIDLRVAEQHYNKNAARSEVKADKYLMVMVPKSTSPGSIAPASHADCSGEYAVYRYAAYKDGKTLWDLDPRNFKCEVAGVDYLEDVRKALGK